MTKKPTNAADRVRRDIDESGAWLAYQSLLGIAQDASAPAAARAQAGVAVLRAGGLLEGKKDGRAAEPSELDGDELHARLREIVRTGEAEIAALEADAAVRGDFAAESDEALESSLFD